MSEAVDPTNSRDEVRPGYQPPVSKLLTLGSPDDVAEEDYAELGIRRKHVPELLRMMTDPWLNKAREGSMEADAPLHAWRAAAELGAMEVVTPVMTWFDAHGKSDEDWFWEELAWSLLITGEAVLPQVGAYLQTEPPTRFGSEACIDSLIEIGRHYEEKRPDCVVYLKASLERFSQHSPAFNAYLINGLIYFRALAVEPLIEQAVKAGAVDAEVCGDWDSIQTGLRTEADYDDFEGIDFDPDLLPEEGLGEKQLNERLYGGEGSAVPDILKPLPSPSPNGAYPSPTVGRNDPCPCGSGKKYKKCCG